MTYSPIHRERTVRLQCLKYVKHFLESDNSLVPWLQLYNVEIDGMGKMWCDGMNMEISVKYELQSLEGYLLYSGPELFE